MSWFFFDRGRKNCLFSIALTGLFSFSCKSVKYEILQVPPEYDGVQPKDRLDVQYYTDMSLSRRHKIKPNVSNVKPIPIRSKRKVENSGQIILELTDGGETFYADEAKFFYNYSSCKTFKGKVIRNLSSVNGLVYSGDPIATKVQLVHGRVLENNTSLGYFSYIMQIGTESYLVSWIGKFIAYCEGNQPVSQIMDSLIIKDIPEESMTVCDFGILPKDEIIAVKFERPIGQSCFYKIKQAWRYDIEKSQFVPKPYENIKCGIPFC